MSSALWLAVVASALGTLLIGVIPFLWMQRRLNSETGINNMLQWLGILGPLMIAAALGVSLMPVNPSAISWIATAIGLSVTLLMWWRVRSLGWPVAAGVTVFGVVQVSVALIKNSHWLRLALALLTADSRCTTELSHLKATLLI